MVLVAPVTPIPAVDLALTRLSAVGFKLGGSRREGAPEAALGYQVQEGAVHRAAGPMRSEVVLAKPGVPGIPILR